MNEVTVMESAVSVEKLTAHVDLIKNVMNSVMKKDEHYGVVPGIKKPFLFKAGAEKLSMTFRLRPIMKEGTEDIKITELGGDHREVRVMCHILTANGDEIATGVGSCSTMESKYRYRGGMKEFTGEPVPQAYWAAKKAGDKEKMKELIGAERTVGKNPETQEWEICEFGDKMDNVDLADVWNTVLKMAKKRAYVDGMLSATGASDIFTQDEDAVTVEAEKTKAHSSADQKPAAPATAPKDAIDIIGLGQCKVGQVVNVKGYVQGVKPFETGTKKTKMTDFTVGDLADSPTATVMIRMFGTLDAGKGEHVCFNGVKVEEFQGAIKYLAKELVSA